VQSARESRFSTRLSQQKGSCASTHFLCLAFCGALTCRPTSPAGTKSKSGVCSAVGDLPARRTHKLLFAFQLAAPADKQWGAFFKTLYSLCCFHNDLTFTLADLIPEKMCSVTFFAVSANCGLNFKQLLINIIEFLRLLSWLYFPGNNAIGLQHNIVYNFYGFTLFRSHWKTIVTEMR
jgi:hypothetical protein